MCCDGWYNGEADGECPKCGEPTVQGEAQEGCHWSPICCDECGRADCDLSC